MLYLLLQQAGYRLSIARAFVYGGGRLRPLFTPEATVGFLSIVVAVIIYNKESKAKAAKSIKDDVMRAIDRAEDREFYTRIADRFLAQRENHFQRDQARLERLVHSDMHTTVRDFSNQSGVDTLADTVRLFQGRRVPASDMLHPAMFRSVSESSLPVSAAPYSLDAMLRSRIHPSTDPRSRGERVWQSERRRESTESKEEARHIDDNLEQGDTAPRSFNTDDHGSFSIHKKFHRGPEPDGGGGDTIMPSTIEDVSDVLEIDSISLLIGYTGYLALILHGVFFFYRAVSTYRAAGGNIENNTAFHYALFSFEFFLKIWTFGVPVVVTLYIFFSYAFTNSISMILTVVLSTWMIISSFSVLYFGLSAYGQKIANERLLKDIINKKKSDENQKNTPN